MSREWKPGDVGISMVGERFIVSSRGQCFWPGVDESDWSGLSGKPTESDRLLVVIDPEDREAVERLRDLFDVEVIRQNDDPDPRDVTPGARGNALQAALREYANPKPPKPDEPTGRYAVVVDDEGNEWLRGPGGAWCEQHTGERSGQQPHFRMLDYARIAVVRVLSPGVEVDK